MNTAIKDSQKVLRRKNRRFSVQSVQYKIKTRLRALNADSRKLPDFIIVGAQRSGTTSLYQFLTSHVEFYSGIKKEIHFFDNFYSRGLKWYKSHFPNKSSKKRSIDASPYYMFHPLAIDRIASVIPDVKIIALLRNPVDRAFSQYKWEVRQGYEKLNFDDAIKCEKERLNGEREKIQKEVNYYSLNHQHHSYVERGKYYRQVKKVLDNFPQKNCLFLDSEALFNGDLEEFQKLALFLEIDKLDLKKFKETNATRESSMDEDKRKLLQKIFEKENEKLYSLLNRDFKWK